MFTITIETDNAAFQGDPGGELARILGKLAGYVGDIDAQWNTGNVMDINGNTVGEWRWTEAQP